MHVLVQWQEKRKETQKNVFYVNSVIICYLLFVGMQNALCEPCPKPGIYAAKGKLVHQLAVWTGEYRLVINNNKIIVIKRSTCR